MLTRGKTLVDERFFAVGRRLGKAGLTPNRLSLMGLFLTAIGAWFLFREMIYLGVLIAALGAVADILDGLVARSTGKTTVRGGFLDALSDRYADLLIIGALLLGGWLEPLGWDGFEPGPLAEVSGEAWALGALSGALLTSYARAAAERLGVKQESIGLVERPERIFILGIGLLAGQVTVALCLLTFLGHITVLQRAIHFWRNAPEESA